MSEECQTATIVLKPGTLWERTQQQTEYALQTGALQPIQTEYEFVEHQGASFLVRVLSNLVRKEKAKQQQPKDFNPFLPYDEDLFVSPISKTHLCLLNKFNVVDHHLLIVTREFEEQDTLLTQADFEALGACMQEIDGLAFYNGGTLAGASQRHKHLQLVPLPIAPAGMAIPIEAAIASAQFEDGIGTVPHFPFRHAIAQLEASPTQPDHLGAHLLQHYQALITAVGLGNPDMASPGAYNLLATRSWMMVVPRSQESFADISVNSLGFAGALLVRNHDQMQHLKDLGPMTLLQQVGIPKS
jgi:ATP adenylyltransferase